ncbi:hypothetical protein Ciccas_005571 [Cichlidogyrus casuarinus]|uniref:Uncharacterized protein n=1 Tax=Cichlidogyrus casuarinus TaxID=1844966 RepID=A0ABD2Q9A5_9PLAT
MSRSDSVVHSTSMGKEFVVLLEEVQRVRCSYDKTRKEALVKEVELKFGLLECDLHEKLEKASELLNEEERSIEQGENLKSVYEKHVVSGGIICDSTLIDRAISKMDLCQMNATPCCKI